jgi:hypothetical protein
VHSFIERDIFMITFKVLIGIYPDFEITLHSNQKLWNLVQSVNTHLGNKEPRAYKYLDSYFTRLQINDTLEQLGILDEESPTVQIVHPDSKIFKLDDLSKTNIPIAFTQGIEEKETIPSSIALMPQLDSLPENGSKTRVQSSSAIISLLLSALITQVLSFLDPRELAKIATVSICFFGDRKEPSVEPYNVRRISFMPGRNDKLDDLIYQLDIKPIDEHSVPIYVHRIWLQNGLQVTEFEKKIFRLTRNEILAGRLSVKEAVEEINCLISLDSTKVIPPNLRLRKIWFHCLDEMEIFPLNCRSAPLLIFKLLHRPGHLESICQALRKNWTEEELINLKPHQVQGLLAGFTLKEVKSAWFKPIHAEVCRNHGLSTEKVKSLDEQFVLKEFLRKKLRIEIAPTIHDLKSYIIDNYQLNRESQVKRKFALSYSAIFLGSIGVLTAMEKYFSREEWQAFITTNVLATASVYMAGTTPLHYVAKNGYLIDLFIYMESLFKPEEWKNLIKTFLDSTGETPFSIAVNSIAGILYNTESSKYGLIAMRRHFNNSEWRILLLEPFNSGRWAGATPLYVATSLGHQWLYNLIKQSYTNEVFKLSLTKLVEFGEEAGKTPVGIAVINSRKDLLVDMGNYFTVQEFREVLTKPLTLGTEAGKTILQIIATEDSKTLLNRSLISGTMEALMNETASSSMPTIPLYIIPTTSRVKPLIVIADSRFISDLWEKALYCNKWIIANATTITKMPLMQKLCGFENLSTEWKEFIIQHLSPTAIMNDDERESPTKGYGIFDHRIRNNVGASDIPVTTVTTAVNNQPG